jgi:hypothetical protein
MRIRHHLRRLFAAFAVAGVFSAAPLAQAASVSTATSDARTLGTMGSLYIHSRHVGTMPYWGDCYRCQPTEQLQSCTTQTSPTGFAYSSGGNNVYIESASCDFTAQDANTTTPTGLSSVITYDPTTGDFTGQMDITGISQYGQVCGGNSGLEGTGTTIVPMDSPAEPAGCTTTNQSASGPPISVSGEMFSGGPITVGNAWGNFVFTPSSNCLSVTFNNSPLGYVCMFPTKMVEQCTHYAPTSQQCLSQAYNDYGTPSGWSCNTSPWSGSSACQNSSLANSQWLWGFSDGNSGTTVGGYFIYSTQYDNTTNAAIPSTLYMAADTYGWVWINGQQVLTCPSYSTTCQTNVTMPTGYSTITYMVMSAPSNATTSTRSPAAGILSIVDYATGATLAGTNKGTWWLTPTPPSTPSPTPQSVLNSAGDSGFTPINCTSSGSNC